jgi:hypothetical protein
MKIIKKMFTSYTFSLSFLFLGITCLIESSSPTLSIMASADAENAIFSVQLFLVIVGGGLIVMGISSIITRYLTKNE